MASLADRIVEHLRTVPGALDDDELATGLGVGRKAVNQAARRLADEGVVRRSKSVGGKLVNLLVTDPSAPPPRQPQRPAAIRDRPVRQEDVKHAVAQLLRARGFDVTVAPPRTRGIDVEGVGPEGRIVVETGGQAPTGSQPRSAFLAALGGLVQRMGDERTRYALALPDDPQCRGLVSGLPELARRRLGLHVFFVGRDEDGELVATEEGDTARS